MAIIAVIGAGSWGTALAHTLSNIGHSVRLWAYEEEVAASVNVNRENTLFLPGIKLPQRILATTIISQAIQGADFVVTAIPSHVCRSVCQKMLPFLDPAMVLISATKGIEAGSLMRMSEVIHSAVDRRFVPQLAVLSGPSFAQEVARGDPAAVVVASGNRETARTIQEGFSSRSLRLYTSDDVIGVELGGAIKNVIAIAAGVIEGLGLGHNPKAALITRGLAEMTRLACACGARSETLAGLAGMGDLVLTCTGELSRNRRVGSELGRGRKLDEIVGSMRMVAEGVKTTDAAVALAEKHGIEMPITKQVQCILQGLISPREAIRQLMERSLKPE
ncbi:MAG: NAD(P)-dependent glycerol-3-phosphate dehydrogenase [Acidobacteria bacterium]|nr:NAD(P)-dependent glycerol-3-phosphate dehydrogenase [Acidobacteriota bacterium]